MAASLEVAELSPKDYQPRPGEDLPDLALGENLVDDELLAAFDNNTLYGTNDVSRLRRRAVAGE